MPRTAKEVDAGSLAEKLREEMARHPGADVSGCVEFVNAAPVEGRRQGTVSMFNFGQSYGKAKAVLEVLGIPFTLVTPKKWKGAYGLKKAEGEAKPDKDASRQLALVRFPGGERWLARKKDHGRADALLLALWLYEDWQS